MWMAMGVLRSKHREQAKREMREIVTKGSSLRLSHEALVLLLLVFPLQYPRFGVFVTS
jgi:hypothetical protein